MDIVHYRPPYVTFTWFPPHVCCNAAHGVGFDRIFLVSLFTIGACIAGMCVDEFMSMVPEIYHWIQICFISLPPCLCFILCGLSECTCVDYYHMLDEACNCSILQEKL